MRPIQSNRESSKKTRRPGRGRSATFLICLIAAGVWAAGKLERGLGVPIANAAPPASDVAAPSPAAPSPAAAPPSVSAPAPELPRPFVAEGGDRLLPEFVFQEVLTDGSLREWGFVDLRGRPIVAVSWATWCGVCAKDLPKLQELQRALSQRRTSQSSESAAKSVFVAALSIDDLAPRKIAAHLDQHGLGELRTFHDSNKMFFLTTSGVGVPSAIIADREGRIVARAQGSVDWQDPKVIAFIESLAK